MLAESFSVKMHDRLNPSAEVSITSRVLSVNIEEEPFTVSAEMWMHASLKSAGRGAAWDEHGLVATAIAKFERIGAVRSW